MNTITKTFEVYQYNELSEEAKEKAVNDHIKFVLEVTKFDDMSKNMQKAVIKAEEMQTPWFVGGYVWDYCKDEILKEIKQYNYLKNGEIFNL